MKYSSLILTLPVWMETFIERFTFPLPTVEARMRFVIAMALENIRRKTGGPFAAALFDAASGDLIAPGVNRVVPLNCSLAHAEMMALGLAQQHLDTFNLGAQGCPEVELVTSAEPCAMCSGALPWSGIRKLVFGATDADARAIGFDEGAKMTTWVDALEQRGIAVTAEVCRKEAGEVLREYAQRHGVIYNGRVEEKSPNRGDKPEGSCRT
ncbi:MAG: nucleoside deaminase [Chitinispirillaceae bacterium]|nr:nucleoside deaminase [Chitinispirillaceae bacterium]